MNNNKMQKSKNYQSEGFELENNQTQDTIMVHICLSFIYYGNIKKSHKKHATCQSRNVDFYMKKFFFVFKE